MGLDTLEYKELTEEEKFAMIEVIVPIAENAADNAHKRPKVTTLLEEVAEMILSFRGKHDDSPELELTQIAGICINLLWQMKMGYDVNNIITKR